MRMLYTLLTAGLITKTFPGVLGKDKEHRNILSRLCDAGGQADLGAVIGSDPENITLPSLWGCGYQSQGR